MKVIPFTMIKQGLRLVPNSSWAEEQIEALRTKKPVLVQITQPRNPEHNDRFWSIAAVVAENDDVFLDADYAVEWVKLRLGLIRQFTDWGGRLAFQTISTDFASMDQLRFNNFYDRALWAWSERLNCDVEAMAEERWAEKKERRNG